MGIKKASNAACNQAVARAKPASLLRAKILVTDRPFDIIDESNFVSYINSHMGVKFISYLNERVKAEKDINIKNKIKYILVSLMLHKMPAGHKDILFRLFNNFQIEHYKYNTYVERTTDKDKARYSHILHSRKGNEFLTRLAQEYPLLHKKFAGVNKKSSEKFDIDSLVSTDQIIFLKIFNQFFITGGKSITIEKPSPAIKKHLEIARRKVLPSKPGKGLEDSNYWKNYVHNMDPDIIEKNIKTTTFKSRGLNLNLTYFETNKNAPNILYIPSTSGYSLFSAELLYNMHLRGYNVFALDFQGHGKSEGRRGDATINEISKNCSDAVNYISKNFNGKIGVCGASLGGFVTLYLGLSDKKVKSIACQNPTILNDKEWRGMIDKKAKEKLLNLELLELLLALFPNAMFPTVTRSNDDSFTETDLERKYFKKSYVDPNTQKDYTGLALFSQTTTPPPRPLKELKIPTMFLAPSKDTTLMPLSYIKSLQERLPSNIKKRIVKVNGGHWWMHSHPEEAAKVLCDWFDETLK